MAASETESGDDMWERICSGLPARTRDGNETDSPIGDCLPESFCEIFSPIPGQVLDMDLTSSDEDHSEGDNGWTPLADSDQYLAALENRLRKLKGLNEEPNSKEMLRSLSQAKKECWDRFLHEQFGSDVYSDEYEIDQSAIDHFKRWLQPERVAVSAEEVQYLIDPEGREEPEGESYSACEQ
ncbi:coiled-coil domain-containing protein 32 [Heptranchias perlo]|uniref:coiled-coil domain-containing protein 32 n=1 Tax=Heptranchias perlo TaxID=212740 RepID=UPI00355A3B98